MTLVSSPDVSPSHSLKETYIVSTRSSAMSTYIRHEFRLHHACHFMIIRAPAPEQRVNLIDEDLYRKRDEPVVMRWDGSLTILGSNFRASENKPATSLLDSPNHLFVLGIPSVPYATSDRKTHKLDSGRLINVAPLSLAKAFAIIVFPHPGCP